MTTLDPALTVPCPTCYVKPGEQCRSRRAISLHQSRREALAALGVQADGILAAASVKPARKPQHEVVGRTGEHNIIPAYDGDKPPWEP